VRKRFLKLDEAFMARRRDSLSRWISVLYRFGQMHHTRALEPLGIKAGQVSFLATLYRFDGLLSQDELAERLHIDKGTACRALHGLEEAGYIRRECDPNDKRIRRVKLTDKAHTNREAFFNVLRGWNEVLLVGFDEAERSQIMDVVRRLAENAARATVEVDH